MAFVCRTRARWARGAVLALGVTLCSLAAAPTAGAVPSPKGTDPNTTAVAPTTTATTAPPASTTTVPTTTSSAPPPSTTTSTVPARTTTTSTATTTTTTTTIPPTSATGASGTPWGLIALIAVLVIAIVVVALLLRSRRRRDAETQWRDAVVPALSDAQLARDALLSGSAMSDDSELRGAVSVQTERAASALERAAASAPDPHAGALATSAGTAVRNLAFAIEAERLLRHGASAPSGTQLAQADEARRARNSELSAALARLSTRIGSAPPSTRGR